MKKSILLFLITGCLLPLSGQVKESLTFGQSVSLQSFLASKKEKAIPLKWIDVNTTPATWRLQKDILVCSGQPIGVMRSEKQYENFILHIEWKHMEAGGNSGVFVWSGANPPEGQRLPDGVEVQMLDKEWVRVNKKNGVTPVTAYVSGELFGVGGVETVPDNQRGTRSKSIEDRCKGKGEWNTYDVVCIDGAVRLSVNGKFVNGITRATQKKGYLCLESEGAEIHFRNLRIIELDPGWTPPWFVAPSADNTQPEPEYQPVSVHPDNPHYFLFRGKPALLIGSTEHYGAVMNLDFDYVTYFNELAESRLNVTRTFTGIYVEPQGAFRIQKNTLAPAYGRFICPWARSREQGYANGGNKFDLTRFDDAYFERLKDFVYEAGKRNIVVELDLFSNFYDTLQWKLSPLYHANNINGIGKVRDWKQVLSIRNTDLIRIQEEMVRKIVTELKDYDNLYYEICNEPYFGDTTALRLWEDHMTAVVADAIKAAGTKHMISHNIQNKYRYVPEPRPHVSLYNFHYASPPRTVPANYHLNLPLGDNETGFVGIDDLPYRREAWDFILAGGALYNNLDYSFTADDEDGTYQVRRPQPGGGGRNLRDQFKTLVEFMDEADFISMKPLGSEIVRLDQPGKATVNALGNATTLILYINSNNTAPGKTTVRVSLPAGNYRLKWTDPRSGYRWEQPVIAHTGGWMNIVTEEYVEDQALKIEKVN
jgi:hypothetical protein